MEKGVCDIAGIHSSRDHTRAGRSASLRSPSEIQPSGNAERATERSHAGACEHASADRHQFGLRPTARARISTVSRSNPDRVYLRAAAGTSPVVAVAAATHRGRVHQWINALQLHNLPTFSKLFQRPRPSQPGQARPASRSVVTVSELDPASDAGRRAKLEECPGERRAISVGVHYHSPRWFHVPGREKMGLSHAHVHLDSLRAAWPSGTQWMARWRNKHRDQRPDHSEGAIPTFHQPALWPPFAAL